MLLTFSLQVNNYGIRGFGTDSSNFVNSTSIKNYPHYRPQHSCGKVMFSQASVILFMGAGGSLSQHASQVT